MGRKELKSPEELAGEIPVDEFDETTINPVNPIIKVEEPQKATRASPKSRLDKILPDMERVQIYGISKSGKYEYIDQYSYADLERAGSLEVFLKDHVCPFYEYTEFLPVYIDKVGKLYKRNSVTVSKPLSQGKQSTGLDVDSIIKSAVESVMKGVSVQNEQAKQAREAEEKSEDRMIELMKTTMLTNMAGAKQGNSPMDMLVMMMVMNAMKEMRSEQRINPYQIEQMVSEAVKRSIPKHLLEPTTERSIPMLPPLESLTPDRDNIRDIIEAVKTKDSITLSDIMTLVKEMKPTATTANDLLTMLPTIKDMLGVDSLKMELKDMKTLLESTRSGGDIFDNISKVTSAVRTIKEVSGELSGEPTGAGGTLLNMLSILTNSPLGDAIATAIKADAMVKARGGNVRQLKQPEQKQIQQPPAVKPKLPKEINKIAKEWNKAETDDKLIECCFNAFQLIMKSPEWESYSKNVMNVVTQKQQAGLFEVSSNFVNALSDAKKITPETATKTVGAINANLEQIWKQVLSLATANKT